MTSNTLPTPKTRTIKLISKGVNSTRFPLVEPDTGTYIDVNLFHFNGQETISVNGVKVIKKRSFRITTKHRIDIDGQNYDIIVKMKNLFNGCLRVSLLKDGEELDAVETDEEEMTATHWLRYIIIYSLAFSFFHWLVT